jgi:hypothetical protein
MAPRNSNPVRFSQADGSGYLLAIALLGCPAR